jgi:hypothetical protein
MVIIRRTPNGLYRLAKLDGTVLKLHFATFHLVPYYARSYTSIPVTCLVEHATLAKIYLDEDGEEVEEDPEDEVEGDVPEME